MIMKLSNRIKFKNNIIRAFGLLIILLNIYWVWASSVIISNGGGAFGFGIMILPISLSINVLIVPAIISIKKPSKGLLILNGIGLTWSLFWTAFFLSVPCLDC